MTKADVIDKIVEQTGLSRKDALNAFEIFLSSIKEGLQNGEKVALIGFGTFYMKTRRAREGRNPRNGESINIPEKSVAVFKPGKAFRMLVNDGTDVEDDGDDEE